MSPKKVVRWENNIKNPANSEYVNEVSFNQNGKKATQKQFNKRYDVEPDSIVSGKSLFGIKLGRGRK